MIHCQRRATGLGLIVQNNSALEVYAVYKTMFHVYYFRPLFGFCKS